MKLPWVIHIEGGEPYERYRDDIVLMAESVTKLDMTSVLIDDKVHLTFNLSEVIEVKQEELQ